MAYAASLHHCLLRQLSAKFIIPARTISVANSSTQHQSYFKTVSVLEATMNYVDTENNRENAVVFIHGNPTSSYLWRNVIPCVKDAARCLAPDLIGMGYSSKVPNCSYMFTDHYTYLSEWMNSVDMPQKVNLVLHDWGSALGFHWANQNRDRVMSIVHMESLVGPLASWDEFPEGGRKIFQAMRSPAGEEMVLQKNVFVERILPSSILRKLSGEEMDEYKKPFLEAGESRLPTLTWPRQIPIKGDGPDDVIAIADSYERWLSGSDQVPKLYIHAKPGFFAPWIKKKTEHWPNQKTVTVRGAHFAQEDSGKDVGYAIRAFLKDHVFV